MDKKFTLLFCLLVATFLSLDLWAQHGSLSPERDSLQQFNSQRQKLSRQGMLVLGGWAVGNLAISGIALGSGSKGSAQSFHQMNIGWNAVNLAIAGFGYYSLGSESAELSLAQSLQEQESMKRILLFNAGLDVAYMAGGAYLLERAKTSARPQRDRGFGRSIIMNGAFLMAYDLVMYFVHQQRDETLYQWVPDISMGLNQVGLVWKF